MPGLTVYVHLPRIGDGSLWLPLAAFPFGSDLKNGASITVFLVNGERVCSRGVVVKAIEGDQVEVASGLMKGDRIVLAPPGGLQDGDQVTVSQP
jgi:multidrug efflux pump subunit AcrA (membrane-fusion protein)